MKQSISKIIGQTVETKDGKKGSVKDVLFDEKLWVTRYVEADFGGLFASRKVLIPRVFIKSPNWEDGYLPLELTEAEIEKCPKIGEHLPVSRKYEEELYKHFDLQPYWTGAYMGTMDGIYPPRPIPMSNNEPNENELDSILRSFNEVEGYHVNATDGDLGHIEDIIVDDENWQITYVVIDTKNWLPWSKKVLVSINWMENISYTERMVAVKLNTGSIKNAPEYKPANVIDAAYEKSLVDYYSINLMK